MFEQSEPDRNRTVWPWIAAAAALGLGVAAIYLVRSRHRLPEAIEDLVDFCDNATHALEERLNGRTAIAS